MSKRSLDLFLALFGIVVLAPVFIVIAIGIKLESPGTVFYRQTRVGQAGRLFQIFKFRTMLDAGQATDSLVTVHGDKRITRMGRVLRKYKFDELPQLFNVIAGEMSLVGPRPEVPHFMALYSEAQRNVILSVKPGLTDFAALELRDEEVLLAKYPDPQKAYVEVLMPRKYELYEKYISNQGIALDLQLIIKTIAAIVVRAPV